MAVIKSTQNRIETKSGDTWLKLSTDLESKFTGIDVSPIPSTYQASLFWRDIFAR